MATTIEGKIEDALFGRVRDLVLSPALPVAWPNVSTTADGNHLRVKLMPNLNRRRFLAGSDPHFRQGILQLVVVTGLNQGPTEATEIAGSVAEHFPADLALYEDGVKVVVQAAPDVGPASSDDSASWEVVVSVRYECFA